jgi:hypothetical protein
MFKIFRAINISLEIFKEKAFLNFIEKEKHFSGPTPSFGPAWPS